MALSQVTYTGNGVTQTFSLTFNYLNRSHVKVFVNGVEDTTFTWATASTVTLSSVPPVGAVVLIERVTPTAPIVDFVDGSNLTEVMLDNATRQGIYIAEETQDEAVNSLRLDPLTNTYPAGNRRITNIANPVNAQDVVTKDFLDTTYTNQINTAVTNAQNSATTATTQAGIATTAANSALDSLDQFDDRYLGSKDSAPTADNDGNALLEGALYWNSVSKTLFIWNGTAWVSTATAGVTSFNSRTGTVSLTSGDVTGALGFTPPNSTTTPTLAGNNSFTGNNTLGGADTNVTTITSQLSANGSVGTAGQTLTSRGANLSPQWTNSQSIGIGQTWQNVTASRALGTTYTNTTGRPIAFAVSLAYAAGGSSVTINVGGLSFGADTAPGNMNSVRGPFLVPVGATYSVTNNSGITLNQWSELRT